MELIVSEEIDSEFLEIVKPILRNKEFLKLGNYLQHQKTSRLEHSINVSYIAWKIAKNRDCDERIAAIAGLLHDFCVMTLRISCRKGSCIRHFIIRKQRPGRARNSLESTRKYAESF